MRVYKAHFEEMIIYIRLGSIPSFTFSSGVTRFTRRSHDSISGRVVGYRIYKEVPSSQCNSYQSEL